MNFILKDYNGNLKTFTLDRVEDVKDLILLQLAGDECLIVTYRDGSQTTYDSCDYRSISVFDSAKTISFQELKDLNHL